MNRCKPELNLHNSAYVISNYVYNVKLQAFSSNLQILLISDEITYIFSYLNT